MDKSSSRVRSVAQRSEPVEPEAAVELPARFWQRAVAFAVDWTVCFLVPSLVSSFAMQRAGLSGAFLEWLWLAFLSGCVLVYFTLMTMRGRTLGMALMNMRAIDARTGSPPDFNRAFARGVLALLLIGSWFTILLTSIADPAGQMTGAERAVNYGAIAVFMVSLLGNFMMVFDPHRRTLQDKLTGVIILQKPERPRRR